MGWLRLSGTFPENPKVIDVGPRAAFVYVACLCWSAEHETDGHIPMAVFNHYTPYTSRHRLVTKLSPDGGGLMVPVDTGFVIPDFADFNPTHEQQEQRRAADRARQARWRNGVTGTHRNGVTPELF
jgi:hypothetical protein